MPSNKETLFQNHIAAFLEREHKYLKLKSEQVVDKEYHLIEEDLIVFIKNTQPEKYNNLQNNFGTDADAEIIKALKETVAKKTLWLVLRDGLTVRGIKLDLYKPKPRSNTSSLQEENYQKNIFTYKTEYRYNSLTDERIDLVIWLNGLPIIVGELKHEDEGQNVDDAIFESFLTRDLNNRMYKLPFMFLALTNTEAKVATNPNSEKNFLWFNSQLVNKAETEGEYPVEHVYRHALSKENIVKYLEHYLVFVPAIEEVKDNGQVERKNSFTIFPRYHQFRASKNLADNIKKHIENTRSLGKKYLINHSAGSGKTLTIAWMADLLDSLYTSDNKKVFDNIIILTDRRALDKNVKDDLENFAHLHNKINFTDHSKDLATYLEKDRDIIVSTIHKFAHIQEKLQNDSILKKRKVAFLIDEAHRSQDGKLALTMRQYFNDESEDDEVEELEKLNINNQVFVAFTATTTAKTVSYFGEPFDVYSEAEAITEGYILDVAQNIIRYETLYNLRLTEAIPEKDFPIGTVSNALKTLAYNDDSLIQYKSEVIVNLFEENVADSINGKGKAMVVTSSRPAGYKYFQNIKTILEEKELPYKVLFAFSDFTDEETKQSIEEVKVNELDTTHDGKLIEDVFDLPEYRILIVANKFQTGFDQPLLSAMFLDKAVKGVNAIQTVSRLNRKHPEKEQEDILVVDFTNNSKEIFEAFNKHRKGSPFKEKEPDMGVLVELYNEIISLEVFSDEEIELYINAYNDAEREAKQRSSNADTILSNLNQKYRELFKKRIPQIENQKQFVGLLKRYTNLFYFIAKFFKLNEKLTEFIVFAEVVGDMLMKKGKTSEMKEFLKKVELSKGAVKYHGHIKNPDPIGETEVKKTGLKFGSKGSEPPRTTIELALAEIESKYNISKDDAIVIKEICEEVSNNYEIKERVVTNRENQIYLKTTAEPRVKKEVKQGYIIRDMVDKLEDPIYSQRGGIISLMGKAIIRDILNIAG